MGKTSPRKITGQRAITFRVQDSLYGSFHTRTSYSNVNWDDVVESCSVAATAESILVSRVASNPWRLVIRDPNQIDDLRDELKYYESLLSGGGGFFESFTALLQWILTALLRYPTGVALELVRWPDSARVVSIIPIDPRTIRYTRNFEYPIEQIVGEEVVRFPRESVAFGVYRNVFSIGKVDAPGFPPPMQAYRTILLLNDIDDYYSRHVRNVPPPGILNFRGMSRSSVKAWAEELEKFMRSNRGDPILPIAYENDGIDFVRVLPGIGEIQIGEAYLRYVSVIASAYGLSPTDIIGGSGESLAGTIREDRRSKMTGLAILKKLAQEVIGQILPAGIGIDFVDFYDEEASVSNARTLLADSMALERLVASGVLSPQEARLVLLNIGKIHVTLPEVMGEKVSKEPEIVGISGGATAIEGTHVPAGQGGMGIVKSRVHVRGRDISRQMMELLLRSALVEDILPEFGDRYVKAAQTSAGLKAILLNIIESPPMLRKLVRCVVAKMKLSSTSSSGKVNWHSNAENKQYLEEMIVRIAYS